MALKGKDSGVAAVAAAQRLWTAEQRSSGAADSGAADSGTADSGAADSGAADSGRSWASGAAAAQTGCLIMGMGNYSVLICLRRSRRLVQSSSHPAASDLAKLWGVLHYVASRRL